MDIVYSTIQEDLGDIKSSCRQIVAYLGQEGGENRG